MKILAIIATFLFCGNLQAASKGLDIGEESNSGYENLTCKDMVVENLKFQAQSQLNENILKEGNEQCLKIGSKQLGGLLTFGKAEREQCFRELWSQEKKFENKMNAFVNALGIRLQIYDSLNIQDKSKLSPECLNVTAKSYQRPVSMSDDEFFRKLYLKCKIKTEVQMGPPSKLKALYKDPAAYADRETCQNYLFEYSKIRYGETFSTARVEAPAATASEPHLRCQTLQCTTLLASPVSNPSPCYRNAVIECMTSGQASVNASTGGAVQTGR